MRLQGAHLGGYTVSVRGGASVSQFACNVSGSACKGLCVEGAGSRAVVQGGSLHGRVFAGVAVVGWAHPRGPGRGGAAEMQAVGKHVPGPVRQRCQDRGLSLQLWTEGRRLNSRSGQVRRYGGAVRMHCGGRRGAGRGDTSHFVVFVAVFVSMVVISCIQIFGLAWCLVEYIMTVWSTVHFELNKWRHHQTDAQGIAPCVTQQRQLFRRLLAARPVRSQ